MPIYDDGNLNTAAEIVPDLYVIVVAPDLVVLNGVPTDRIGLVGTASWGPLDTPVPFSSYADYVGLFGPQVVRAHDMGTWVAAAVQQGAQSFIGVRVDDGTSVAATEATTAARITALYTGTLGNAIHVGFSAGSRAATKRVVVAVPGLRPEVYDNLPTATPAAFWAALAANINAGQGAGMASSALVRVTVLDDAQAMPTDGTVYVLAGGKDGAAVTDAMLVGDSAARSGMYALSGSGLDLLGLCDATDATHWSEQLVFGKSEAAYVVVAGPAGEAIADAVSRKQNAGLDAYDLKILLGDWLWTNDQANQVQRLVSPASFTLGRLANLSPERTAGNKTMNGVIGSQRSGLGGAGTYSRAELTTLTQAGIDVVTNPIPRGRVWGCRTGHNSSTTGGIQGDNHPRLTNNIAATLDDGMGIFVEETITPDLFAEVYAALDSRMFTMQQAGQIEDYSVQCDRGNNPPTLTQQNVLVAAVNARYFGIADNFNIRMRGGQTVTITKSSART